MAARLIAIRDRIDELIEEIEKEQGVTQWDLPVEPTDPRAASLFALLGHLEEPLREWTRTWQSAELQQLLEGGEPIVAPWGRLRSTRRFADALALQAWSEALDPAQRQEAVRTLCSGMDLGRALDGGTTIDGSLDQMVAQVMLRRIKDLVELELLDPRVARADLDASLRDLERCRDAEQVLECEIAAFLDERAGAEETISEPFVGSSAPRWWQLHGAIRCFEGLESFSDWSRIAPREHIALAPSWSDREGSILWPSFLALIDGRHRVATAVALTRLALAIEAHRAEHGALPDSLAELAWAFPAGIPLDPVSTAPFAYEIDGEHARLGPATWTAREPVASWDQACERLLAWEF